MHQVEQGLRGLYIVTEVPRLENKDYVAQARKQGLCCQGSRLENKDRVARVLGPA